MGRPKGSANQPPASSSHGPQPLPPPSSHINPTNHTVQWGVPVNPVKLLTIMPPDDWEDFTREYAESLKAEYHDVQRCGGGGDQGRDIVAYLSAAPCPWDNYQCKRYKEPIAPAQIWVEIGKLCYYTFINEYTIPRHYYFVAPHGVGTKLGKLIDKPVELRSQLIQAWPVSCENDITSTHPVKLEGKLLDYVQGFDFSIVKRLSVGRMIERKRPMNHVWKVARFAATISSAG